MTSGGGGREALEGEGDSILKKVTQIAVKAIPFISTLIEVGMQPILIVFYVVNLYPLCVSIHQFFLKIRVTALGLPFSTNLS